MDPSCDILDLISCGGVFGGGGLLLSLLLPPLFCVKTESKSLVILKVLLMTLLSLPLSLPPTPFFWHVSFL